MQLSRWRRATRAAATPVDRHRHGAGAHRRADAGRDLQLRHRSVPRAHRRRRRFRPARRSTARRARAIASSPTICAPPPSSSPTASRRRTKAAAMCCAGSCAAPCAMRSFWARNEPLMSRLAPTLVAEMGEAYPELRARAAPHRRHDARRGDALSRDAGARPRDPRRGDARRSGRATSFPAKRRSSSTTPTAFRSTSPRTPAAARHRRRQGGLQRRDGAPARGRAQGLGRLRRNRDRSRLVRARRNVSARPSSSATRRKKRRRRRRHYSSTAARTLRCRKARAAR